MTAELQRMSPHNRLAERSVLGGVLRNPEVFPLVRSMVGPEAFYFAQHQSVFQCMSDLADAKQPVDLVGVHAKLRARGDDPDAGWHAVLAELWEEVPTGANAEYHAALVREEAATRSLIHTANEVLRNAYDRTAPAAELVSEAQAKLNEVAIQAVGAKDNVRLIGDVMQEVFASIEARIAAGTELSGLPTGYPALDGMLGGLRPGQLVVIGARPSVGKAQPLNTPVLTPKGYVPMGSLLIGSQVIGADGRPTSVIGVYPQGVKPVFRVTFSDGAKTECCAEHLWFTTTRDEARFGKKTGSVKSLAEIARTLRRKDSPGAFNHAIPSVSPVQFDRAASLPLDPWLLGVLLGDGNLPRNVRFNKPERDVQERLVGSLPDTDTATAHGTNAAVAIKRKTRTGQPSFVAQALASMGLMGCRSHEKFIPDAYLYASPMERLSLLRGLLDTDGSVAPGRPAIEYSTSSSKLADGMTFLVQSLGGTVRRKTRQPWYTYRGERRQGRTAHRLYIRLPDGVCPVSSDKHLSRWSPQDESRGSLRRIVSVEPIGEMPCQCIQVANEDGLYVTSDFIVTHNTAMGVNIAVNIAEAANAAALLFSLEMPAVEIASRVLSLGSRVPMHVFTRGRTLDPVHSEMLVNAAFNGVGRIGLYVDDSATTNANQMLHITRRAVRRHKVAVAFVDYLQLIRPENPKENRVQQVGQIARRLKEMARECGIPVVCMCQLNREVENRPDQKPRLSDLRESGEIEQHADVVILLHRPPGQDERADVWTVEAGIAKQRNGPTGTVPMNYRRGVMRFETSDRAA